MAIAYDAQAKPDAVVATSLTYAHTCSGDNRVLFVGTMSAIGTNYVTGITHNGTSLTKIGDGILTPSTNGRYTNLWYLVAPTTGAQNIVVTNSSSQFIESYSVSYTGVAQTGTINASGTNSRNSADNLETTLTTTVADCWFVAYQKANDATKTTNVSNLSGRVLGVYDSGIRDSNASLGAAGSKTGTLDTDASCGLSIILVAFAPVATTVNYTCSSVNTMSLSRVYSPLTGYRYTATDSLLQTEVSDVLKGFFETITESLTLTDPTSETLSLGQSVIETLTLGDSLTSAQQAYVISVVDTILSDAGTTETLTLGISVTEALALRDTLIKAGWSWQTKHGSGSDWTYQSKNS
jgi:hypothetical protein